MCSSGLLRILRISYIYTLRFLRCNWHYIVPTNCTPSNVEIKTAIGPHINTIQYWMNRWPSGKTTWTLPKRSVSTPDNIHKSVDYKKHASVDFYILLPNWWLNMDASGMSREDHCMHFHNEWHELRGKLQVWTPTSTIEAKLFGSQKFFNGNHQGVAGSWSEVTALTEKVPLPLPYYHQTVVPLVMQMLYR